MRAYIRSNCLFIAVDVQIDYVGRAFLQGGTIDRVRAFHEQVTALNYPSWQVGMHWPRRRVASGGDVTVPADPRGVYAPLLPPQPDEKLFGKMNCAPLDNPDFRRELIKANPQAVFLYGYYIDACVRQTGLHVRDVLPGSDVYVLRDTGRPIWQNNVLPPEHAARLQVRAGAKLMFAPNFVCVPK